MRQAALTICLLLALATTAHAQSPMTPHEAQQIFAHVRVLNCGDGGRKSCRTTRHDVPESIAAKIEELVGVVRVSQIHHLRFYVAEEEFGLAESFAPHQLTGGSTEYIASQTGLDEKAVSNILGRGHNTIIITEPVSRRLKLGVGDEFKARLLRRTGETISLRVGHIRKFGPTEAERYRLYMLSERVRAIAPNKHGAAELAIELDNPDDLDTAVNHLQETIGDKLVVWTWRDAMKSLNSIQSK